MAAMKEQPAAKPIPRKSKKGIEFYQFPKAVVDALIRANYAPAWALAAAVYKGWYKDFKKRNPVKLTSALLAEFRISKDQKSQAPKVLEQSDLFLVERFRASQSTGHDEMDFDQRIEISRAKSATRKRLSSRQPRIRPRFFILILLMFLLISPYPSSY